MAQMTLNGVPVSSWRPKKYCPQLVLSVYNDTQIKVHFFPRLENSRFFLKISKEISKVWRKSLARASLTWSHSLFSASFQPFCLTACAYLNTQKYGLFCGLNSPYVSMILIIAVLGPFCAEVIT